MTYAILKERFPHASENFLRANASDTKGQVRRVHERGAVPRIAMDADAKMSVVKQAHPLALGGSAQAEGGSQNGTPQRPRLHFTLYRVALLDPDSKYASVKFVLDALRQAGLIPDDRECDIELIVTQTRVKSYSLEGTALEITYPKPTFSHDTHTKKEV